MRQVGAVLAAIAVVGASIGLVVMPAQAATVNVTNTNNSGAGSLRDAIATAANGDTINITVSGTITLTSALTLSSKALVVTGPSSNAHDLVINGNGNKVFAVSSGGSLTLSNVKLTTTTAVGGWDGGCIKADASSITIQNVTFVDCKLNPSAFTDGGAIFLSNSSGTISNSTFSGSTALQGAAVYADWAGVGDTLVVTNSSFSGNAAGVGANGQGGAIASAIPTTVSGSTFTSNSAGSNGGAISVWSPSWDRKSFAISSSTFTGNLTSGSGGAVSVTWMMDGSISDSAFNANQAANGGALDYDCYGDTGPSNPHVYVAPNCVHTLHNSSFIANTATGNGGAIRALDTATQGPSSGSLSITGATIEDNTAGLQGGGIFADETPNQVSHYEVDVVSATAARNTPNNSSPASLIPAVSPSPSPTPTPTDTPSVEPTSEATTALTTSTIPTVPAATTVKRQTQSLSHDLHLPNRLPRYRSVVLMKHWATTSAGGKAVPHLHFSNTNRSSIVGDVRMGTWKVSKRGKVTVTVLSSDDVNVTFTLRAPGTDTVLPLRVTKVWRLR